MGTDNKMAPLGEHYPMAQREDAKATRDLIMMESALLFARDGYDAVSMRDIADQIGRKAASIYNHFESKEALRDAILDRTYDLYMQYFARLEQTKPQLVSFEETLESMFVELRTVVDIFTYYSFAWVQAYQFCNEKAAGIVNGTFLDYSIGYIKDRFDECVAKGWCKSFDTKTVASFFMHSVLVGIKVRLHEHLGHRVPYDVTEMYKALQAFIHTTAMGE